MSKNHKKYHLAVSYTRYPQISQLTSIKNEDSQKLNEDGGSLNERIQNIFNNNFQIRLRKLQIQEKKNYEVVGYKEIQDINIKLDRKKRLVHSGTKETKLTFHSRNQLIKNNEDFLTKEEVVRYFSPHHINITMPTTSRSKEQSIKKSPKKDNKEQNTSMKYSKRLDGKHCSHKSQQFSLAKLKQKMNLYQSSWAKQIENKRKLVKRPLKHSQTKVISVLQSVDSYRAASEDREKLVNQDKCIRISPTIWQKILRSSKENNCVFKQTPHISARGLKSVGMAKYKKQLQWLQYKNKQGYFFKKNSILREFPQKNN